MTDLPTDADTYHKKHDAFTAWLRSHGSEIRAPSNGYEIARFTTPEGVGVIYRNGRGRLSYVNGADKAFAAFQSGDNKWRVAEKRIRGKTRHRMDALIERDGGRCWFCDGLFPPEGEPHEPGLKLTMEHLVPVIHGGPDHLSNLVLAHEKCNGEAGNLSVAEKVRLRERLNPDDRGRG